MWYLESRTCICDRRLKRIVKYIMHSYEPSTSIQTKSTHQPDFQHTYITLFTLFPEPSQTNASTKVQPQLLHSKNKTQTSHSRYWVSDEGNRKRQGCEKEGQKRSSHLPFCRLRGKTCKHEALKEAMSGIWWKSGIQKTWFDWERSEAYITLF